MRKFGEARARAIKFADLTNSTPPQPPTTPEPEPYRQIAELRDDLDGDGKPDDLRPEAYLDQVGQHIRVTVNKAASISGLYGSAYANVRLLGSASDGEGRGGIVVALSSADQRYETEYWITSFSAGRLETMLDDSNARRKLTAVSPDANRIIFSTQMNLQTDLMDFRKRVWKHLELPGMSTGLERIEWIGDAQAAFTAHVNPR